MDQIKTEENPGGKLLWFCCIQKYLHNPLRHILNISTLENCTAFACKMF